MIRQLHWTYVRLNGIRDLWQIPIMIPPPLYAYYRSMPRYTNYTMYVLDANDEDFFFGWLTPLVYNAQQQGYTVWEIAELLLNLVSSLPYYMEIGEYPRYPVETLWDGGGDCEDVAILTTKLWRLTGFKSALIHVPGNPGHMAAAIAAYGAPGGYIEVQGIRYYYAEATSDSSGLRRIGDVPPDIAQKRVQLSPIPVHPSPILRF